MLVQIKPNILDVIMHFVVGIGIGIKYGIIEGIFAFAVVATLDQILWAVVSKKGE